MAYCRWNEDCDLYIYKAQEGYYTHVAACRVPKNMVDNLPERGADESTWERYLKQLEPIGLPHDGESYCDQDVEDLLVRVACLRALGYRMPDAKYDALKNEVRDGKEET